MTNTVIGQSLSIRFGRHVVNYVVIGTCINHHGRICYAVNQWNKTSKRFVEFSEDSYYFQEQRAVWGDVVELNKVQRAMAKAYRIIQIMPFLRKRIRSVSPGVAVMSEVVAMTSYRGRYDMEDMSHYISVDSDSEYLFGNPAKKAELLAKQKRLQEKLMSALFIAGIVSQAADGTFTETGGRDETLVRHGL